ncbi:FtsL-like putative cell division protein [Aquirufa sp. ROCK2-A2]
MAKNVESTGSSKTKNKSSSGLLDLIFNLDPLTGGELPIDLIKKMIYVACLIIVYIFNSMVADGEIHQIAKIKTELQEVRADYTTQKAEYMKAAKQSYLALEMKKYNLELSLIPPIKVVSDEKIEENK